MLILKSLKISEVPSFYECIPLSFTNIFNWVRTARVSCDKSVALFICWDCTLTFVTFVYLFVYCPPPDCISDFCDHPIWQPGIWQAQISLSANSAFYLFSPFSALVHGQTNFVTWFENIMFRLTVSWLYRCNILRALPHQKLFVLNWCSVVWWPLKVLFGNKFKEHPSWIQSGRVLF